MNSSAKKISVLIVDQQIDQRGILSNAALVIGLTVGRELPAETFGADVLDSAGITHRYLTNIGHFVRKASQGKLRSLRATFSEHPDVLLVDYTEDAAPSNYDAYAQSLAARPAAEISYRAIYVYGPEEIVVPLTKNLSRLE